MSPMPMGRTTECSFRGWPPQPLSKVMCDVQPREQCAAAASFTIQDDMALPSLPSIIRRAPVISRAA